MSHLIVIFGASGDLTKRKLIPALYALFRKNRLPDDTRIIGVSRTAFSHDEWRAKLAASTDEFVDDFDSDLWQQFARSIYYQPGDIAQADDFRQLDQFLSELARRLTNFLPPGTLIGRLGADQFALLLDEEVEDQGYASARQLKAVIEEARFHYEEHSFVINCALAVAGIARGSNQAMERLRSVEAAASLSKKKGYKDVLMVRPGDRQLEALDQVMVWVTRINRALDNDNLALLCQQITPIGGNRSLPHYEILLSVLDEQGEAMPPAEFIKVAEEYNRMAAVDHWVIEHVLLWMHENPEQLPLFGGFSVNLSGQSLNDDTFLDFIFDAMVRYPVPREKLVFEITETVAMEDIAEAQRFIAAMRELGCRLALDDFGAGYTSFGQLRTLSIDLLKIDGSFIKGIATNQDSRLFVQTLLHLAKGLGVPTVAEFIETDSERDIVIKAGVDFLQGYGIGQPEMVPDFLKAEKTAARDAG